MSFANAVPDGALEGALEVLKGLPGPVEVRSYAGWSEKDIRALGEELHYSVLQRPDVADAATSIDTNLGTIHVVLESTGQADMRTAEETTRELAAVRQANFARSARSDVGSVTLSVSSTRRSVSSDDNLYGGSKMTTSTGGYCTAGFSVRSSNYANGMLTAAHCPNSFSIGSTSLSYRAGSSSRDVQWHSSSSKMTHPSFYVAVGSRTIITSAHNPVSGTTVCKYGQKTGGSCDRVTLTNQCRSSYCGLFVTEFRRADQGDSGGPWYCGNAGYGIHSGRISIDGDRDSFTGLQNAASTLGITVKLG